MANFSICGQVASNTGAIDCDIRRAVPQTIIVGSGTFTPSDYATPTAFKAAFIQRINQGNTASSKLFPFPVFQGNTDKTVAAKEATLGYGLTVKLLRSKPGYEFDVLAGSSLEKKLIKYDGQQVPLFVFDSTGNVWGIIDASGNFKGANYLISVEPAGFADGQNINTTKVGIALVDSRDFTENSKFASTTFSTSDLTGLVDATLFETTAHTTNVYKIGIKITTDALNSSIDVHGTSGYPAALASASLWVAKAVATGATIPITSVADDTVNSGWTVTLDNTTYGALATGAKISIGLADPSALSTAGVVGIESVPVIVTK
jgi:hypothetical protein